MRVTRGPGAVGEPRLPAAAHPAWRLPPELAELDEFVAELPAWFAELRLRWCVEALGPLRIDAVPDALQRAATVTGLSRAAELSRGGSPWFLRRLRFSSDRGREPGARCGPARFGVAADDVIAFVGLVSTSFFECWSDLS